MIIETIQFNETTIALDYSKFTQVEEILLDLDKLAKADYRSLFEVGDKTFIYLHTISEYSEQELLEIFEDVL